MCNHRAVSRWHLFWSRLTRVVLVVFLAPEIYALLTVGPDASYSGWFWHCTGVREPCRHTPATRAAIVAFSAWVAVHLGWGRLGFAPPRRLSGRHNQGGSSHVR